MFAKNIKNWQTGIFHKTLKNQLYTYERARHTKNEKTKSPKRLI